MLARHRAPAGHHRRATADLAQPLDKSDSTEWSRRKTLLFQPVHSAPRPQRPLGRSSTRQPCARRKHSCPNPRAPPRTGTRLRQPWSPRPPETYRSWTDVANAQLANGRVVPQLREPVGRRSACFYRLARASFLSTTLVTELARSPWAARPKPGASRVLLWSEIEWPEGATGAGHGSRSVRVRPSVMAAASSFAAIPHVHAEVARPRLSATVPWSGVHAVSVAASAHDTGMRSAEDPLELDAGAMAGRVGDRLPSASLAPTAGHGAGSAARQGRPGEPMVDEMVTARSWSRVPMPRPRQSGST